MSEQRLSRRSILRLAGIGAASLGTGGLEVRRRRRRRPGSGRGRQRLVRADPEMTEGPFYIAREKVRRNITDGHPGTPLVLRLTVVDASTCKPIKGAAVDIWHADAAGNYSGFGAGSGNRTFMRGIQRTDANGVATFRTVHPGWYQGRTVHIHVKVHV
jgi:protocatechuate 3,4-dioxygenase beta subunit